MRTPSSSRLARRLALPTALLAASTLVGCAEEPPPADTVAPLSCDIPRSTIYRVDQLRIPTSSVEADRVGVDLDGDGTIDDQLAGLFRVVADAYADRGVVEAWQARLDARLDALTSVLIQHESCPAGDERFTLIGGELPLGALGDFSGGADEGWSPLEDIGIAITASSQDGDGAVSGTLTGALVAGYEPTMAEAFLPFVQGLLDAGETEWGGMVDTDGDGVITVGELLEDDVFEVLTRADLDTDGDGEPDALSLGLSFRAVPLGQ